MGYSITLAAPTEELMDKMFEFLADHFQNMANVEEFGLDHSALRLGKGHEDLSLSYFPDDVPYPVGFDYSSWISMEERIYAFRVIEWMAVTLGVSYYWYDSEKKVDVKPLSKEDVQEHVMATGLGMMQPNVAMKVVDFAFEQVDRLQKLWEETDDKR